MHVCMCTFEGVSFQRKVIGAFIYIYLLIYKKCAPFFKTRYYIVESKVNAVNFGSQVDNWQNCEQKWQHLVLFNFTTTLLKFVSK